MLVPAAQQRFSAWMATSTGLALEIDVIRYARKEDICVIGSFWMGAKRSDILQIERKGNEEITYNAKGAFGCSVLFSMILRGILSRQLSVSLQECFSFIVK